MTDFGPADKISLSAWQRHSRETWKAILDMRHNLSEHVKMPSPDELLAEGPDPGVVMGKLTEAILQALKDAEAAQALVVERAELAIQKHYECLMGAPPALLSAIRALAPDFGVAALAALRARAENAEELAGFLGMGNEGLNTQLSEETARRAKAERERDDALTRLTANEAQAEALTSLLERAVVRVPPAFHSLRAEIRAALASAGGAE